MSIGYRLVTQEGGDHEDRSVIGWAGLEPDKPAMSESEASRIREIIGGRLESFECNFVMPEAPVKGERVPS